MCTNWAPALMAIASIARCDSEPFPIEAKLYFPGFLRSRAMRSATELTPSAGLTASTLGWVTNWVTVAMSLRGSQGNRAYNRVLMASGPPMLTPMVEPSGVAFATRSVPRLSPAPGLFSTINALAGYFCCKPSATSRATMSLGQKALRSAPSLLASPVRPLLWPGPARLGTL